MERKYTVNKASKGRYFWLAVIILQYGQTNVRKGRIRCYLFDFKQRNIVKSFRRSNFYSNIQKFYKMGILEKCLFIKIKEIIAIKNHRFNEDKYL